MKLIVDDLDVVSRPSLESGPQPVTDVGPADLPVLRELRHLGNAERLAKPGADLAGRSDHVGALGRDRVHIDCCVYRRRVGPKLHVVVGVTSEPAARIPEGTGRLGAKSDDAYPERRYARGGRAKRVLWEPDECGEDGNR